MFISGVHFRSYPKSECHQFENEFNGEDPSEDHV